MGRIDCKSYPVTKSRSGCHQVSGVVFNGEKLWRWSVDENGGITHRMASALSLVQPNAIVVLTPTSPVLIDIRWQDIIAPGPPWSSYYRNDGGGRVASCSASNQTETRWTIHVSSALSSNGLLTFARAAPPPPWIIQKTRRRLAPPPSFYVNRPDNIHRHRPSRQCAAVPGARRRQSDSGDGGRDCV